MMNRASASWLPLCGETNITTFAKAAGQWPLVFLTLGAILTFCSASALAWFFSKLLVEVVIATFGQ